MIYVVKKIENESDFKRINCFFRYEYTSRKDILFVLDGESSLDYLKRKNEISFFGRIILILFSKKEENLLPLEASLFSLQEKKNNLFITNGNVYFSYGEKSFFIGKEETKGPKFDFYINDFCLGETIIKRFDFFKISNLDYLYFQSPKGNSQKELQNKILSNPDGFLYDQNRLLTNLKEEDLPEYYVRLYSSFEFSYVSSANVRKIEYRPSNSSSFLENDSLNIFYKSKDNKNKSNLTISGNCIIDFLLACLKYSTVSEIEMFEAINKKVRLYNLNHPNSKRNEPFFENKFKNFN